MSLQRRIIDRLSDDAMDDVGTIPNNPRKAFKEDIIEIYEKALPLHKEKEILEQCTLMEHG